MRKRLVVPRLLLDTAQLVLTHRGRLPVKRTVDEAVRLGQPEEAGVAQGVAAEEQPGDLVPLHAVHVVAHPALQDLPRKRTTCTTAIYSIHCN